MPQIIDQMLSQYKDQPFYGQKNEIKEVVQEIVLCGLSRGGFFNRAAFYGGTALRIFYGLDRFSEDLDFSLTEPDSSFDLQTYIPFIENEVNSYGLNFQVETHEKRSDSVIQSAFLKGNTKEHIFLFFADEKSAAAAHKDELIRIKFEVDTNPPQFAGYDLKYRLLPIPYAVQLYDLPSLFAGKIHAVLCRAWQSRVKGRDLYDYVFYLSRNIPVNLRHLDSRLHQTGFLDEAETLDITKLKILLRKRFESIDYEQAKQDVLPFIARPEKISLWSSTFFQSITENMQEHSTDHSATGYE